MRTRRYAQSAKATVLCAVVILSGLAGVGPAAATDLQCGSVITTDTTLTHNMTCPGDGFLIGADNVTINLGGFVLEGMFASGNPTGNNGIETQGHSDVVVMNGTVRRFSTGVLVAAPVLVAGPTSVPLFGGTDNRIDGVVVKNNFQNIRLRNTANAIVTGNKIVGGGRGSGVEVLGGVNNSILNNTISNSPRYGVLVDFTRGHLIQGNTITYSGSSGVSTIPSIIVRDNKLAHNKGPGIHQYRHGQDALDGMTITGNRVCGNGNGIVMTAEGHTITDNDVGAGTTGCLPNTGSTGQGYDLYDEVAASSPVWDSGVCPSTWRNNYTEGDTFNHPCVTK